ncbi:hypothetical protein [Reichenbachiella sp. MALMAid0571]|uniref:hypothetical protein n=1 Tax=Reichenbachiella sp. MALMAid0571 TaxID=3143939 RepID=UPI0032DE4DEE
MNILNKALKNIFFPFFGLIILSNCGDDDPITPPNEEELITTVNIVFTPTSGTVVTMKYYDEDGGNGAATPVVTGGSLVSNTAYTVTLELLNESENPTEDITEEIEEEGEDHQFFFEVSSSLNLTHTSYNDQDGNENPIGLKNTFTTGAASSGTLKVILRHEPDKSAAGVSDGDITNAAGETDIETLPAIDITIID